MRARDRGELTADTFTASTAAVPHNVAGRHVVERVPEPWLSFRALRRLHGRDFVTVALLLVDAIVGVLVAAGIGGSARVAIGLTACLTVPGWAVVAHLNLRWPAAEAALTLAASLAILLVIAQLMISVRAWHPFAAWLVVSGLSAVLLIARLVRSRNGAGTP